ncbi:MAG: putative fluoride ion transporter CrcB [Bryobacteraceae bacterium]|nr:putative fluoride ion transporter CrcB [Bryobacteraceae bacterium]
MRLSAYLWIALGSALGGMGRFWLGSEITARYGTAFPWGTFTINVLGSFLIGFASTWSRHGTVRLLVMVGICGGFTTFSSFSLETVNLLRMGAWQRGGAYVLASVGVCAVAAFLGLLAGRLFD